MINVIIVIDLINVAFYEALQKIPTRLYANDKETNFRHFQL